MGAPDISVVLVVHDDAVFLNRTLRSLEEAVQYAAAKGLTTELLLIANRATPETIAWLDSFRPRSFFKLRVFSTDFSDPGPARDHGTKQAGGKYVTFADGDDLISYNFFADAHQMLESRSGKVVCFPKYVYEFGDSERLHVLHDLDKITPLAFFRKHPFNSRLMGRTADLRDIVHLVDERGVAFEDWHYNNELVASGFDFIALDKTILFYRKSASRRNASALRGSAPVVAHGRYHSERAFLAIDYKEGPQPLQQPNRVHLAEAFTYSATCRELLRAASLIDPAVNASKVMSRKAGSNIPDNLNAALCYREICRQLKSARFDQVVLVPYIVNTGAEKYIFSVLEAIKIFRPHSRILFISGQKAFIHAWLDRLPEGSKFVDLMAMGLLLDDDDINQITLRTLLTFAPGALVHLKPSRFGLLFLKRHFDQLEGYRFVYYRFGEALVDSPVGWVAKSDRFEFLSAYGTRLDMLIYDNVTQEKSDLAKLDFLAGRTACIYNKVDLPGIVADVKRPFTRRLLWASRLDRQKRPAMLLAICETLADCMSDVHVDIWGFPLRPEDTVDFSILQNATYKGPYAEFADLPLKDYDAIIYTSAYDGMPNILLECMSAGISVIAPDVGGIAEAVNANTGYLLPNLANDGEMCAAYVAAIASMYSDHDDAVARRLQALDYVKDVHGPIGFQRNVQAVFGPLLAGD